MKKSFINFSFLFILMFLVVTSFAPLLVLAQSTVVGECQDLYEENPLQGFLCRIGLLLNSAVPILITLGVVYFIYGVISYAIAKDEEAKTKGRGAMIWGLIALMVIVSVWGLVNFIKGFVGIGDNNTIAVPCVESPGVVCPQSE